MSDDSAVGVVLRSARAWQQQQKEERTDFRTPDLILQAMLVASIIALTEAVKGLSFPFPYVSMPPAPETYPEFTEPYYVSLPTITCQSSTLKGESC